MAEKISCKAKEINQDLKVSRDWLETNENKKVINVVSMDVVLFL